MGDLVLGGLKESPSDSQMIRKQLVEVCGSLQSFSGATGEPVHG